MKVRKKNYVLISVANGKASFIRQFEGWTLMSVEEYVSDYCTGPLVQYVICEIKSVIMGKK